MRLLPPIALVSLASPAAAAQLATGSAPEIPWLRLIIALAVSTAVAAAAIFALRRKPGASPGPLVAFVKHLGSAPPRQIAILETRRASQHGDLCLVEVDETIYLLAITASGATLLERRETTGKPAPEAAE